MCLSLIITHCPSLVMPGPLTNTAVSESDISVALRTALQGTPYHIQPVKRALEALRFPDPNVAQDLIEWLPEGL